MSLVGNLEDLSLGDIMQIISLSQKFGVLALESECGQGRIVFSAGLVQGASLRGVEGHFCDLRELVIGHGILDSTGFDLCAARAVDLGLSVEEMLRSETALDLERLDALIKEAVETAVLEMFTWPSGDFSFDVRSDFDDADPKLVLRVGLNAQYLAMEGMRMRDEEGRDLENGSSDLEPELSAHEMFGVDSPADLDEGDSRFSPGNRDELTHWGFERDETTATDIVVAAVLEKSDLPVAEFEDGSILESHFEEVGGEARHERATEIENNAPTDSRRLYSRPLILIDPDVAVLEWVKCVLGSEFSHVHVFQQADQGLMRIRQYLIRGELPVILISPDCEVDPLSGIRGLSDFVKRLKAQAEKLPVFGLVGADEERSATVISHLDGVLSRPSLALLREELAQPGAPAAQSLSTALAEFLDV